MGKQSSTQVTTTFSGDGLDSTFAPAPLVNTPSAPSGGPVLYTLAAGDNTMTLPAGVKGMVFSPPTTGGTADLILKGNAGDTGVFLDATKTSMIALDIAVYVTAPMPPPLILRSTAGGKIFITWL